MTTRESTASNDLDAFRGELLAYCRRFLGSGFAAEDAVQETLLRGWRGLDRFEGRAGLRSWLYRIATNVCHTMWRAEQRQARPLSMVGRGRESHTTMLLESIPHEAEAGEAADPAAMVVIRESVRLAFSAAVEHLPPRQRAVLILREVLRWRAGEVAELLGTTTASVNSALQRARHTLARMSSDADRLPSSMDAAQHALISRCVDAFERADIDALTALLGDARPSELRRRDQATVSRFLTRSEIA